MRKLSRSLFMKKMLLVEMSSLCFKLQASVPNYSETRTVCINILEVAVCYFGMRWINGHYLITIDDTIKIYIPSVLEPIGTINIIKRLHCHNLFRQRDYLSSVIAMMFAPMRAYLITAKLTSKDLFDANVE